MAVLHEGQKLGPYEVKRLLGMGGMAEVYLGVHTTLEREVAIKVLNPAFNADPTFPLRFRREAKTVARLNHPNIITVHDFGEQGDIAYLVMELATDGSFETRAAALGTLADLVRELGPICEGLHFAHAQGVVHRDLKPENILLTEHERKLLADFGLARIRSETLDISDAGMVLGTPHYMAPEQVMGEDVDQRADVYALGVMLYQLLTGDVPFQGQTFFAIAQRHLKAPVPNIANVLPGAPAALDQVLRRAMAKRREDRYESVPAFLDDLRRAAAETPALPVGRTAVATASRSGAVLVAPSGPAGSPTIAEEMALCGMCGRGFRGGDRFCRGCGSRREESVSVAAALPDMPDAPAVIPGFTVSGVPQRRRPSALSLWQRALLAVAAVAVLTISVTGFWLWHEGRAAALDVPLSGVTTYIYDHLRAFKSGMTVLALLGAFYAALAMRAAVLDPHRLSPETYRRLRQTHRLAGYAVTLTVYAIGVLLCIGLFGFKFGSVRVALHSVFGTLLLATLLLKVVTVRWLPALRGRLDLIGMAIDALFVAVFLTSTVPYVYEQLFGSGSGYVPYG